jgi:hypothetical protein
MYLRPALNPMTLRRKIAGLCAAATLSLAVVPPALAAPAGDEYLPKVPQSGGHSSASGSSASGATGTTTLPTGGTGSPTSDGDNARSGDTGKSKKDKTEQQVVPVGSSGGSDGGDSSGSIFLNPIVLLIIAAVIAVAVGMTLRRRSVDEDDPESPGAPGPAVRREAGPRTPDGEIATGRDRPA